ncbi:YqzE family protein [Bacillus tianshenii]|nr:YqzE family protein [Bacillus tianshenii]
MSTNDYVKFVTQQIVSYMDQPKEERQRIKQERLESQPPALNRWFGVIPFALAMFFHNRRKKK